MKNSSIHESIKLIQKKRGRREKRQREIKMCYTIIAGAPVSFMYIRIKRTIHQKKCVQKKKKKERETK